MANPKLFLSVLLLLTTAFAVNIYSDEPCPSIIGCEVCSHPETGQCDVCSPDRGFIMQPDEKKQCQCKESTWLDQNKTKCGECSVIVPECLSCSSQADRSTVCDHCADGYYWNGSFCIHCYNGHPHCLRCTQDG